MKTFELKIEYEEDRIISLSIDGVQKHKDFFLKKEGMDILSKKIGKNLKLKLKGVRQKINYDELNNYELVDCYGTHGKLGTPTDSTYRNGDSVRVGDIVILRKAHENRGKSIIVDYGVKGLGGMVFKRGKGSNYGWAIQKYMAVEIAVNKKRYDFKKIEEEK